MAGKWSSLFVITGVLATAVAADRAYGLELDPGRVLTFHSEPSDGCPGLDWHVVIGPNHRLTGFIAWDQMKDIARVDGTADVDGKFQLALQPVNGTGSTGSVEGQLPELNGWLVAHVNGAGCPHQDVHVEWFNPTAALR
jgi:hypothetical protein